MSDEDWEAAGVGLGWERVSGAGDLTAQGKVWRRRIKLPEVGKKEITACIISKC